MQEAAAARAVARQEGVVTRLGRGRVHAVSLAGLHERPDHQDGGVVALREGRDGGERAGGWGETKAVTHVFD